MVRGFPAPRLIAHPLIGNQTSDHQKGQSDIKISSSYMMAEPEALPCPLNLYQNPLKIDFFLILILQMSKWRLREVKRYTQGYTGW